MKMKKLVTAALAGTMILSASVPSFAGNYWWWCKPAATNTHNGGSAAPWIVIGCAGGIVAAALAANYRDGRELTAEEAWSCGTLFLVSTPKHHKRHHRHH